MSPLKRLTRVNKADIIDVYKCSVCSEEFHTQFLYDIHMNNHNEDFPYSCDMCQYRCRIRKYLTRHKKKVHTKANGPACTVCGKVFHYGSLLRNHMRVHTGERPYRCEVCNKSFNSSYCLSMHKLIHTNEKPFECKFCEYACRDSSTLRRHEERHLGIGKTYPCRKCKKSFDTKAKLRIHVDEVHYGLNPKQIACEQCGRRFKTLTGKNTHIKTVHERIGRSQCEICDRVISRNNMGAHLKSHVDIRPFSCSFKNCKKQFKDRGTLKKHTLIHYPDLYFQCDLCDSRFVRQARLRQHKKWHVVNGFTCDYCGGIFSTKRYLQMHIKKIHVRAAEKFVCDECESVHFTKQSIILHLKYGHGRRYEKSCRICGDVLQNNAGLSEHYLKVHKVRYILIKKEDDVTIKEEPEDLSQEFVFNYEVEKSEVEDSDLISAEPIDDTIDGTKMVEVDIPPNIININKLETTLNTYKEPDMKSIDYIPEYADTETTLEYSAKVLEEDLSRSVTESETKQPDSTFEEFFIKEIVDKSKKKKLGKEIVDKNKLVDLQKRIDQMIKETRIQKTSIILEKMRQKYNRRIEMANKNKEKRVPAKIKYFKKSQNETTSESDIITRRDVENEIDISIQNDDLSIEDTYASDHIDGKNTNDETSRPKRTRKKTKKYDDNDDEDNKTGKLKFDGHECNVCFKVFKTKEDLKFHCKEHFDICNEKMLKKCPFCGYVTNLNIKRHIEIVHKININYDYAHIAEKPNASGSKYVFEIDKDCELEIIPSISNLNKIAGMKVDEKRRKENNLFIGKTKLVKKGGEWVVEKQSVGITSDNILPVFTEDDYKKVKLTGDTYLDRLQQLGFLAKKRGAKMLYPCDSCEKICQTLPALKLHNRKHEENPKQFKPKVWVNRHVEYKSNNRKKLRKIKETPRPMPVVFENRKKKSNYMIANRYAAPQPVKNNHKCDKGLIEFYKNHIRGKDIEFWQFLKIFNKINRENVNDFEDLVNRDDVHFGIHSKDECIASNSNRNISQNDTNHKPVTTANSSNESGNKPVTNRNNQNDESLHVNNKPVTTEKSVSQKKKYQIRKNVNKKMRRVIISKSENIRRNAIKNEMRQRLANNTI